MVCFNSIFELYIEKISILGFLAYSLKIIFIIELIPCPFFLMQQVRSLLKVVIHSYRVGFESFILHYGSILYLILTLGWLLWPWTMVFNHFYLIYIIVLSWIEPPFHEYPSLEHFVVFWYSCHICHRFWGVFLEIFHDNLRLIIGLFLQAIPFIRLPALMDFFRPRSES